MSHTPHDEEDPAAPPRGVKTPYRHGVNNTLQPAPGHACSVRLSISSHPKDNRFVVVTLGMQKITVLRQELVRSVNELDICAD